MSADDHSLSITDGGQDAERRGGTVKKGTQVKNPPSCSHTSTKKKNLQSRTMRKPDL